MIQQLSLSLGSAASFCFLPAASVTHIWKPRKRRGDNMNKFNLWLRVSGALLLWATAAVALPAQRPAAAPPAPTLTIILHSFDYKDGSLPYAGLVQATNGNLYGTTYWGGPNSCGGGGCGTIFTITPGGSTPPTFTTLHSFDGTDGEHLDAGLVQGTDGNFYGTTQGGGIPTCDSFGCGTVFKITPNGTLTTLHNFDGTDGSEPTASLVQDANGDLYGTTQGGGSSTACTGGCGTVFKITPSGVLTTLHSFDYTDGSLPLGLVQATDGNFYGTTISGGGFRAHCQTGPPADCGTVFKITPSGTLTMIYSFCSQYISGVCMDGATPYAGLVQAANGDFYGTTSIGGTSTVCGNPYSNGCGTVFKITPSGTLTTLHSFHGTDGYLPYGALIQATDGDFYGTTNSGGGHSHYGEPCYPDGCGTAFKITPSGHLTKLHSFDNTNADGGFPFAGLVKATNGNFYGTTLGGGANHDGTVFSLSVGLK
jgi:uncharacterized repeat protein (TIGR03803 family)